MGTDKVTFEVVVLPEVIACTIVMFFVRLYVKFGILLTYRLKYDFVLRSLYQAKKVSGPVFVFHDYRF
jgi:hypothetical protein